MDVIGTGKDKEVLPDSQDEAELDTSELLGRDFSPMEDPSAPSLGRSPSFVLPRPVLANNIATSTISQCTTDAVSETAPDGTSVISAFTTSSSRRLSSKPRPKPKPNYAGIVETADHAIQGHVGQIGSIESSSVGGNTQPPSLPEGTFTADISERIKARRALAKQKDKTVENKLPCGDKKPAIALGPVIDISSDEDMPTGPSHLPTSSKHSREQSRKSQSVSSIEFNAPALGQLSLRDEIEGGRSSSSAVCRKRKRDPPLDSKTCIPPAPVASDRSNNNLGSGNGQNVPSKQKKKKKVIDDTGGELSLPKEANKKRRKDEQQLKKSLAKPKPIDQGRDQFKSSEFILDSDDELALGNHEDASIGEITTTLNLSVITTVVSSPLSESPSSEVLGGPVHEPPRKPDPSPRSRQSEGLKKTVHQKRKTTTETYNEAAAADIEEGQPPLKKARCSEDNAESHIVKEKPAFRSSLGSETHATTENDIRKTKKKRKGRKVIEEDEEEGGAKVNTNPLQKPANMITAVQGTKAPQEPISSKSPYTADSPGDGVSGIKNDVAKTKKRGGGRKALEVYEENVHAKENMDPPPKQPSKTAPSPVTKAPPSSKLSCAHPPKNRPLSAILQVVNGSSPRPRASSISRKLLTRIVPLHPNRRTPPPPPPPRIFPRKTKKELEREEKWEEELQETVPGWCDLEEGEREKLRREKRDWELGLYEE